MLSCVKLKYTINGINLFDNLTFSVEPSQHFLIRGRNGCGKTTLLRVMASILEPTSGMVLWHGEDIDDVRDTYVQNIIYIGHRNALRGDWTVKRNLMSLPFANGLRPERGRFMAAMEHMNLTDWLDEPVDLLSQGMQRRVALCRLLLQPAPLWFLDEPFAHLDAPTEKLLWQLLDDHRAQGGAVVLTAHTTLRSVDVECVLA